MTGWVLNVLSRGQVNGGGNKTGWALNVLSRGKLTYWGAYMCVCARSRCGRVRRTLTIKDCFHTLGAAGIRVEGARECGNDQLS
jgi:hypothetical protein